MSPNEANIRKRVGQIEFLVLNKNNKREWFSETKSYLESIGLFYTIDPSYAEKSVHLANLRTLAGVPAVLDETTGAIITPAVLPSKTDEYIDDCNKVKGLLKSFCDDTHASLIENLVIKTPKSYWDCLQGIGGNPDLGAANASLAVMFNGHSDATVQETVQTIRSCLKVMGNTYGQRGPGNAPTKPYIFIDELGAVALIGYLETIPEFAPM